MYNLCITCNCELNQNHEIVNEKIYLKSRSKYENPLEQGQDIAFLAVLKRYASQAYNITLLKPRSGSAAKSY